MNPAVILALIADLYSQVATLTEENQQLRAQLAREAADGPATRRS